jgi:parvulin-like peptidyl-prolyl isomerase
MKKTVFQLELKNIVEYEAEQRKVQETDEYQKRVNDFREGLMVDKFTRQVLGRQINVSEDEIVEYYNAHLDEFTIPQEYHLLEIQRPVATDLGPIVEEIRSGADFGDVAAKQTIRTGMKAARGDLGFVQKSRFPQLWEAATRAPMGQVSDIVVNDDGSYSVIKVLDVKQPVILPIDQVTSQVQASVLELKRASATIDWIKARRAKSSIEVHADVLEKTIDKTKYEKKS